MTKVIGRVAAASSSVASHTRSKVKSANIEKEILRRLEKIDFDIITEEQAEDKFDAYHEHMHFRYSQARSMGKPFSFATRAMRGSQTFKDWYAQAVKDSAFDKFWGVQ